jgi:hypothetical protein
MLGHDLKIDIWSTYSRIMQDLNEIMKLNGDCISGTVEAEDIMYYVSTVKIYVRT